jgi:hypothetical protein
MNRPIEERLRDALRARADEVTARDLTRSFGEIAEDTSTDERPVDIFTGRVGPRRRHRRPQSGWSFPAAVAAVAAAVVALTAGGFALSSIHRDDPTRPAASTSATRGGSATPRPVVSTPVAGVTAHEAPAAQVPWEQVGQHWSAAAWTQTPSAAGDLPATLYLVSPSGVRYAVGQVAATTQVLDVTPDGRRILVGNPGPSSLREWDVTSGVARTITLETTLETGAQLRSVRYTKPSGQALLVTYATGDRAVLERRTLDGQLQLRYPDVPGLTVSSGPPLGTADGLDLVVPTQTGMTLIGNAQGTVVRQFPLPAGTVSCTPVSRWSEGIVLARCVTVADGREISDLWTFPVSGAPSSRLTTTAPTTGSPGYARAWAYNGGTLVQGAAGCGGGPLLRLTPQGDAEPLKMGIPPDPASGDGPNPLAIQGDYAFFVTPGCPATSLPKALIAVNLMTGTATRLLGPQVADGKDGTVVSAVAIDAAR